MARREIYRNLPSFEPFYIVSLDFDNFVPFTGARYRRRYFKKRIFFTAWENSWRVLLSRVKSRDLRVSLQPRDGLTYFKADHREFLRGRKFRRTAKFPRDTHLSYRQFV